MRIALFFSVLSFLSACTVGEDARTTHQTQRQEIRGGTVENNETGVVGILAQVSGGTAICSGTLIAPNLVLTAQHCVAALDSQFVNCGSTPFGQQFTASSMYVTTRTQMSNDQTQYHRVAEILVPPGGNDTCGFDIALLVLNQNIDASEASPLIPRIDLPPMAGETYTAIGYGHVGDGSGAGTRRSLAGRTVQCFGNCDTNTQATPSEFAGSDGTCQGDSGGAPLDAQRRVLGALSRGPGQCDGSVYSSVFAWSDWLREQGLLAADAGSYPPHSWVTMGVSEVSADDPDADGVLDTQDNCPSVSNADQVDEDGDSQGDACDDDGDGDGILDAFDNCPSTPNNDQQNRDDDPMGDLCDADDDNDNVDDRFDNCPTLPNTDQADANADGIGDLCSSANICDRYNPTTGLFDGCGTGGSPDVFILEPGSDSRHIVGIGQTACSTGAPGAVSLFGLWIVLGFARRRLH